MGRVGCTCWIEMWRSVGRVDRTCGVVWGRVGWYVLDRGELCGEGLVVRVGWRCGIPWEELAVVVGFCGKGWAYVWSSG